jgi:hypothetical protein
MRRLSFIPALVSAILLGACSGGSIAPPIVSAPGTGVVQPQGATAVAPAFLTPAMNAALNYKIYVTNSGPASETGSLTTYSINGKKTKPTITKGLDYPVGVAVDRHGKIYVTSYLTNTLTTYNPDGTGTPRRSRLDSTIPSA